MGTYRCLYYSNPDRNVKSVSEPALDKRHRIRLRPGTFCYKSRLEKQQQKAGSQTAMVDNRQFFNRDISWLSFNERVLGEAARHTVPLMERFRFLAIYSSNLDEFYRVRIPTYSRKKAAPEDVQMLERMHRAILSRCWKLSDRRRIIEHGRA